MPVLVWEVWLTTPAGRSDPTKPPGPGWEWKGKPGSQPGDPEGAWHNPGEDQSLRPDLDHADPLGPHWDWIDSAGKDWRLWPDGSITPK